MTVLNKIDMFGVKTQGNTVGWGKCYSIKHGKFGYAVSVRRAVA